MSINNVDEKLKNADNLLINSWFFICIPNVDNVGVDHLKKNHSRIGTLLVDEEINKLRGKSQIISLTC